MILCVGSSVDVVYILWGVGVLMFVIDNPSTVEICSSKLFQVGCIPTILALSKYRWWRVERGLGGLGAAIAGVFLCVCEVILSYISFNIIWVSSYSRECVCCI